MPLTAAMLAAALMATSLSVAAIERIRIQALAVQSSDGTVQQLDVRLLIHTAQRSTLQLRTGRIALRTALPEELGTLQSLALTCLNPVVREPLLACPQLSLDLRTSKWPSLRIAAQANYNLWRDELVAGGTGPTAGGLTPTFNLFYTPTGWKADASLPRMPMSAWQTALKPWIAVPASLVLTGEAQLSLSLEANSTDTQATVRFALQDGGFQNADYTWLGEKLAMSVSAQGVLTAQPMTFDVQIEGSAGQALAGPVVLDFSANPLTLNARGTYTPQQLTIQDFHSQQKDLAEVSGSARLALAPFSVASAEVDARDLRFPAAYVAWLQQSLATTPFNQLTTTGSANASLRIANDQPVALTLKVKDLDFSDDSRGLAVTGVQSELHWAAGTAAIERPSWLEWSSSRGWGIIGARTRLEFSVQDRDFRLLQPARLPFFDGALRINTFAVRNLGEPNMAGDFDALIEPISIGPIAKALGWPEFGGSLSGRIPGLAYRNKQLTLQGDIEAQVFDGRVGARNLRVRDPLGSLPRLYADVAARNLNLDLVTRTFEFGSITGRLDADLAGLETVGLSPVAFDLRIATPAADKSKHRISQRAVENLSNIGGSGGGVAAALQSGALRFFDDFGYDQLGLSCRLRNDVCQMSGAGKAETGFYIVKGAGLPRIDIIGNNSRVAWPTFMSQVANALANPGEINVR
jgi:hypothetical protein